MADVLKEFGIPVVGGSLGSQEAYWHSCLSGVTDYDLGARANTAALEVDTLTKEILEVLARSEPLI